MRSLHLDSVTDVGMICGLAIPGCCEQFWWRREVWLITGSYADGLRINSEDETCRNRLTSHFMKSV
jgi:hypothetical protein